MPVLLITYDIKNNRNREELTKGIKILGGNDDWEYLSESSYAVKTPIPPKEIHKLFRHLANDAEDRLFIITLGREFEGHSLDNTYEWLDNNLPYHSPSQP